MPTPPLVITLWETHGSSLDAVAARVGEILAVPVHGDALFEELGEIDTAELARRNTESVTAAAEDALADAGAQLDEAMAGLDDSTRAVLEDLRAQITELAEGLDDVG